MALWNWQELHEALQVDVNVPAGPAPTGVSIDTRTLQPGDLFVALSGDPGPRFRPAGDAAIASARDGHEFLTSAAQAGASAVLVNRRDDNAASANVPALKVDDTLEGLWKLGSYARGRCVGRAIAITGSSGKTTARSLIQALLESQHRSQDETHASEGSLNNHWGVPLSLARMPRDSTYGVFEVGMNHPGEIAPLAELVSPDVALVLNVAPAHLGFFPDLDAIRREKLTIADALVPGGTLVVPVELDLGSTSADRIVTFGLGPGADICCREVSRGGAWDVLASVAGEAFEFSLAEGGEHRVATALASIAVLYALGSDLEGAAAALAKWRSPTGRGNRVAIGKVVIVDDSYNANPASMDFALKSLAQSMARRKIAILGEMLELGDPAPALHRDLLTSCENIDRIITVGPLMEHLSESLHPGQRWLHVDSATELDIDSIANELTDGDEVLIKGSNRIFWVNDFASRLTEALRAK